MLPISLMGLFDGTTSLLEKSLELRMRAHEVHASNVANANVPNYKAKTISFENALQDAIGNTEQSTEPMLAKDQDLEAAISQIKGNIYEDPTLVAKSDGNTVNVEREQTELAKNTIAYETAIQLINKKFAMARYVLSEGGRG